MTAQSDIERAARLAGHLPAVEVASWYGTPALKVRRSANAAAGFARIREPGILVVLCPLELKEALLEADPDVYFETPHYSGWPAMLVRMDAIDDERLRNRLECAWREKAPKALLQKRDSPG